MPLFLAAQTNLVPNPGFESYTSCPQFPPDGSINNAFPWFQPWTTLNSSDFFNICNTTDTFYSVPVNFIGSQMPKTGDGYAGILAYYPPSPNSGREYLEVELLDSLRAGFIYDISFYVSLGDTSQYACNNIGVHFSDTIILYDPFSSPFLLQIPFHVFSASIVNDIFGWQLISGKFTANGGEKFLVVGNLLPDSLTNFQLTGFGSRPAAYYYFDDFNVSLDSTTSLEELNIDDIVISPNPSTDVFTVSTKLGFLLNGKVEAFNLEGQLFMSQEINDEQKFTIDLKNFASGVYLLKMKFGDRIVVRKLIKM